MPLRIKKSAGFEREIDVKISAVKIAGYAFRMFFPGQSLIFLLYPLDTGWCPAANITDVTMIILDFTVVD
jgi:hypothetical protein